MRLVEGLELGAVFSMARERKDGWSPTRALGVLVRVCETLAYAHSKGVIHRDLKPRNVMVGRYGETYVMDWGLAKVLGGKDRRDLRLREPSDGTPPAGETANAEVAGGGDESPVLTMDGTVVGTPSFMPPEQADARAGDLDQRADIYAVGAMLYTLLAGHLPYVPPGKSRSSRTVLAAVRRGPPVPLRQVAPGAPAELVAVCEKAMARSRNDRYATMDELGEDIRAYLENRVVRAYRTGAAVELRKWVARNRATAGSLAGLFILLVLGLAVSLWLLDRANMESHQKGVVLGEKSTALKRADAMRLCAQSAAVLSTDPGQALLMAIEAARLEPGYRADTALLAALDALREERTLSGHTIEVTGVTFTPDGRRVATAARDGTVRVWDPETGDEIFRFLGDIHAPNGLTIDSGGRLLASFGWGGPVDVWDLEAGKHLWSLPHPHVVDGAGFSADGRRLVTGARDGKGRIWSMETGQVAVQLDGHASGDVSCCRFSANGDRVVTASYDGTARVWDAGSGATLVVLHGHKAELTSAELSPDGRLVATASMDDTARVWDVASGKEVAVLAGHERWLRGAIFSPDGRRILTHSDDATARLWEAATGEPLAVLRGHEKGVNAACFSADSRRVLTASEDRTARVWDAASGKGRMVVRPRHPPRGRVVGKRPAVPRWAH